MNFKLASLRLMAIGVLAAAAAGAAQARDNVYWSLGVNAAPGVSVGVGNAYPQVVVPQPVYVQPAPVYVRPAPVYVRPAPVYATPPVVYGPPPVYLAPAPVYYERPSWTPPGHRHGHGHGHGRGHGHGHGRR